MKDRVIACKHLPGKHDAAALADFMLTHLQATGIKAKQLVAITTDTVNVNGAMVNKIKDWAPQVIHQPCIAHVINLCVNDAVKVTYPSHIAISFCTTYSHLELMSVMLVGVVGGVVG